VNSHSKVAMQKRCCAAAAWQLYQPLVHAEGLEKLARITSVTSTLWLHTQVTHHCFEASMYADISGTGEVEINLIAATVSIYHI